MIIIFYIFSVFTLSLLAYAVYLWLKVYKQRQLKREQELNLKVRHEQYVDSVQLIARALVQGQADLAECAIRMQVLLDRLNNADKYRQLFPSVYRLASDVSHMPILEQRKNCTTLQLSEFDKEREILEQGISIELKEAAQAILSYDFKQDLFRYLRQ